MRRRLTALQFDVAVSVRLVFRATANRTMSYMPSVTVVTPSAPFMVFVPDITTSCTFPSVPISVNVINGAPLMVFFIDITTCRTVPSVLILVNGINATPSMIGGFMLVAFVVDCNRSDVVSNINRVVGSIFAVVNMLISIESCPCAPCTARWFPWGYLKIR